MTGIGRYYTICNFYGQMLHQKYKEWAKLVLEGGDTAYDAPLDINDALIPTNTLPLTIKVYNFPKALSKTIASKEGQFHCNGPHGNGLQIREGGTHIAFSGGTGVLVFLDLVAYIFRKNVHENMPGMDMIKGESFDDLKPDFKFILYIAFPNEQEALGYEFCKQA